MNQGLVSIAVLSLFLTGCDLGKESNTIKNIQTGHNKMADNKQANLQDLDKQISVLETKLERAKNGLLPLDELKDALNSQEETRLILGSYIVDPSYEAEDVSTPAKRLKGVRRALIKTWNTEVDRFTGQLVTDTSKKESHIQDSENRLDSDSIRDAWEKVSSLRQMLEEQKTVIKQVRDEDIERTFAEAENFAKDSEERLKNAMDARERNDYELSQLHIESFYDKSYLIGEALEKAYLRLKTLAGNTSQLLSSKLKTIKQLSNIEDEVDKVDLIEPRELEHLKKESLNDKSAKKDQAYMLKAKKLLAEVTKTLSKAKEEQIRGNHAFAHELYRKALRYKNRFEDFSEIFKSRVPEMDTTLAELDKNEKTISYIIEGFATETPTPFDFSTWDKLKEIDASLKKAQEVADHVDKEIGLYLKYRDREESANATEPQSPIDAMKQESEMVKISLDGSVVPYKPGDPIAKGESTGYTYTSLAQLPSTDTGEAFNGLGGRKRRVVSSSVRVLNAQGLEVGTSFDKMYPIKELKNEAKTGEFECPIGGSFTSQDGLCLRQKGVSTGAITAVVTTFSVGG